jgi:hypothetical protein
MAEIETPIKRLKALKKMKKDNKELVRWQSKSQKTNFLVEGETLGQKPSRRKRKLPKPMTAKKWREINRS